MKFVIWVVSFMAADGVLALLFDSDSPIADLLVYVGGGALIASFVTSRWTRQREKDAR